MNPKTKNITIIMLVLVALAMIVFAKALKSQNQNDLSQPLITQKANLPKLMELGSKSCIPCKAMMPILAQLRKDYAESFAVEFVDIWKDPAAGRKYNIEYIPVQIFFDANDTELFRHVGFFAKEDILAKWKELGINLEQEK